jgi:glycosyltransferase involved in cell wall biosynthesis
VIPNLRIALVSSSSGSRGGGELYLCNLADGLSLAGVEIHSVLAEHARMDELAERLGQHGAVHRIPYLNTYDRRLRSIGAVWANRQIRRLCDFLARLPVDLIHLNKQNLEDGLDLLLAGERTGLPTVATIHVTRTMRDLRALGGDLRDSVSMRVLRSGSAELIATAQAGLADLIKLGIERSRLHLVWNGVPEADASDRERLRADWGCPPDAFVLGCVARIEPQKNPLFLPKILAQLPERVRLVWIGDGSQRGDLEQVIRNPNLAGRVILPGWHHNARSLLAGFDVFVLPSLYEGFPLAILEAMAAGLPCVVSDVDGVSEAIVDGEHGFVCPPNDAAIWLDALRRCLEHPELRADMGRNALARFRHRFSLDAMARKTLSVYEQALSEPLLPLPSAGLTL